MHKKQLDKNSSAPCDGPEATLPAVFYTAANYSPGESVGYLMRRIIGVLSQCIEREFEPNGLTNAQWLPLLKLHMGDASTVAELARGCDLDAGSMTRLLDRLEAKQLVKRTRSVDDRRVVNLELTDAGRGAAKEIPQVLCDVQNAHLAGFSNDEFKTLQDFLRRILDNSHDVQASQTTQVIQASKAAHAQPVQRRHAVPAANKPDKATAAARTKI